MGEALGLFLDGADDDRGVCPVDWRARRMVGDMATFMDFVMSRWAWIVRSCAFRRSSLSGHKIGGEKAAGLISAKENVCAQD